MEKIPRQIGGKLEMKVWVLDNDTALLRSLEILLTNQGYDVECFDNPFDVSRAIEEDTPPNVLVLDYVMPGLTGMDLMSQHRERLLGICCVILISGHTDQVASEELKKLGISAFLPKPLDLVRLEEMIARAGDCEACG